MLKTRVFQVLSARRLPATRALPITMMPMATTSSTSGRPTPITISRAVPPPSGSLGMSPSDWKIRSASGTAVATTSTAAAQPPAFGVVGASLHRRLRRRVGNGQPTRPGSAKAGHEDGERHPEQCDPAPGRIENRCGRDRNGRDEREPVACGNRERQRRRRGTALFRLRAAGDGAQERRQQREGGRGRSRKPRDKPTQRRQARRAGPAPRTDFSGEPAGGAGCSPQARRRSPRRQ